MALEKIGMIWKLEERLDWKVWLSLAKQYHRNYGTLDIPSDHITKDGHRLGFWIKEQRKKRKSGILRKEQIEELDQLGMRWCFYEKRDWNDWYGLAKKYAQEQGNLWIPFDYTTAEGDKLGVWISVQRERYSGKGNRKPLSSSQIKELDQIGMVWSCSAIRKEKWEAMYRWVKSYCQIHGCLPLRPRIKAPDGRSMGSWISIQRTLLQRGCLEESRVQRLSALGIHPFGQSVPKREIKEAFCYL